MPFCAKCGTEMEEGLKFCRSCGAPAAGSGGKSSINTNSLLTEFVTFDKMITPLLIKIIFWLGVGVTAIMAILLIISGASSPYGGGAQVIIGLILLVLGPLFVRVYCELLIIMFKIHEAINSINSNLD
jgi:hypothetical protein